MGYAGGTMQKPTYQSMGDHTEAISIDYDPDKISYQELLDYFWAGHSCIRNHSSRQYMNAVFSRNEQQHAMATLSLENQAKRFGIATNKIKTKVLPVMEFTYAEEYHQKYYLSRFSDIRQFLSEIYPDAKSMADSTVATRLNAYLAIGMNKDWQTLLNELPSYGLPQAIAQRLEKGAACA